MLNQDVGEKDIWDSNASRDGLPSEHRDGMESPFPQPQLPGRASVMGGGRESMGTCFMREIAHVFHACAGQRGGKDRIFIIKDPWGVFKI